jgi:hypothetical protein
MWNLEDIHPWELNFTNRFKKLFPFWNSNNMKKPLQTLNIGYIVCFLKISMMALIFFWKKSKIVHFLRFSQNFLSLYQVCAYNQIYGDILNEIVPIELIHFRRNSSQQKTFLAKMYTIVLIKWCTSTKLREEREREQTYK